MSRQLRPSPICLNCGHAVATRFCPECGQENTTYRVSLGRLVGDLVEELFQLESRLWRTLWTLVRRPGLLTREYNAGRRVAYTTPLRLYLLASVAYFFVGSVMPEHAVGANVKIELGDISAKDAAELEHSPRIVRGIVARAREAQKDPQATIARVRHTITEWAPRIAAGLVPLFALSTWILFRTPKRYFVEHLVFALHAHATAFLLLLPGELPHLGALGTAGFVALLVLLFMAMRTVFGQSRLQTAWKFVVAGAVYSMFLGIGIAAVAALGFFATRS